MSSYIRSTTSYAFAPLRATHSFLSSTYSLVSRTGSEAKGLVKSSISYLRRDRTAPAAALVGLGPLLLGVIKDAKTEKALTELLQLLKDALNILQREEVQQITSTSLSLLSSRPVTDLVKHASSTLISLLHVLQTPAVDKVRAQLDLYFSYLLATEAGTADGSNPGTIDPAAAAWARAHSAAVSAPPSHSDEVGLRECVQLLLLLEILSAHITPTPPCTCEASRPAVTRQEPFSQREARLLRAMVRKKDMRIVMLYRVHLELARSAASSSPSGKRSQSNASSSSSHSADPHSSITGIITQMDGGEETALHHASLHPTSGCASPHTPLAMNIPSATGAWTLPPQQAHERSASMNDGDITSLTSSSATAPSSSSHARRPSMYTNPRSPAPSFAHKHRSSASLSVEPERKPATPNRQAAQPSPKARAEADGWYARSDSEEEAANPTGEGEEIALGSSSRKTSSSSTSSSASAAPDLSCHHHVPVEYARFTFLVREMLADLEAEDAELAAKGL